MGRSMYESFFPVVAELNQRFLQGLDIDALTILDAALAHVQNQADKLLNEARQPKANGRRSGKK